MDIKDYEKLSEHLMRINFVVNQVASNGEIMKAQYIVKKIMRSPLSKFDQVVVAIEELQGFINGFGELVRMTGGS